MIAIAAVMLFQTALPAVPPAPYPNPGPRAEALGRTLAEGGTLASLLPLMVAKDTEEMVAAHPDLTPAERKTLRGLAREQAARGIARLIAATGHAYATRMSEADLAAVAAFQQTPAARAQRAATMPAIVETMQSMGALDFKEDTLKAFCAKTGKGCPPNR